MAELKLESLVALDDCGLREGLLMDYLARRGHSARGALCARAQRAAPGPRRGWRRRAQPARGGARRRPVRQRQGGRPARPRRARPRAAALHRPAARHRLPAQLRRPPAPHLLPHPQRRPAGLRPGGDRAHGGGGLLSPQGSAPRPPRGAARHGPRRSRGREVAQPVRAPGGGAGPGPRRRRAPRRAVARPGAGSVVLTLHPQGDWRLEEWGLESRRATLQKALGAELRVVAAPALRSPR